MAHFNSQCPRPPFLSATAVGSGGKAPTPEADDILALEHTFLRYPAWFLSDSLCRQKPSAASYEQERDRFVHFLRLLAVCWPSAQSAADNRALAYNFAKYSQKPKLISQ